jgi:hypothetical protein
MGMDSHVTFTFIKVLQIQKTNLLCLNRYLPFSISLVIVYRIFLP